MKRILGHWHLSLRAKVSLLTASVLMSIMVLFGVVLYISIGRVLIDNTAQSLRTSAGGAINERLNGPRSSEPLHNEPFLPVPATPRATDTGAGASLPGSDEAHALGDLARMLTTRDTAALTTDTGGTPTGDGPQLAGITAVSAPLLNPAVYQSVAAANQERHFRYQTADGPALVELVPLARANATPTQTVGVLELSTSLRGIDTFLGRLRLLLMVGTLLAVLITILLMVPLIANVLRPLRRMAGTSRAIAAGDLSLRVPVPHGDDELTDLAQAFNEMVGKLEMAFATQRRFVASASHELRSPLAALGGGIEMLVMGADRGDSEARARLLRLMESEVARMGRLVDDLLLLTRFDANPLGALQRAPVDLTTLAAEAVEVTRLLAPDREVRLEIPADEAIIVAGDADRLRQALLNLCANARAYTAAGGTITVGVRSAGQHAALTVADTGEGIPAADLPRIWDRFYRVDPARARQSGQGGLGLGLAIVQAIIAAHGGTAAITSVPNEGTTVTLTLPGASVRTKKQVQSAAETSPVAAR
ncbi:MAG: HAMP domain-containing histidine kinase [Chloroflexota bacterium]|nr:HAMP domain-containing histidine kinase [Chloroflexota bacterium]